MSAGDRGAGASRALRPSGVSSRSNPALSRASRALNPPRPARVRACAEGVPCEIDGQAVELVRESWLVEDRWWTECPLRRRYWEVVSVRGRNLVVFHELPRGGWFAQGA